VAKNVGSTPKTVWLTSQRYLNSHTRKAVVERFGAKAGSWLWERFTRGPRYVHMDAGHAAENVLLQAVALGLGAVPVAAFHDDQVRKVLPVPREQQPLYLIPVGHLSR
jgi:nitroreductase